MTPFAANVMGRVVARFKNSDLSLHEFGEKMGYPKNTARKSAWQFLHKTADPRLTMLEKAAKALSVTVASFMDD